MWLRYFGLPSSELGVMSIVGTNVKLHFIPDQILIPIMSNNVLSSRYTQLLPNPREAFPFVFTRSKTERFQRKYFFLGYLCHPSAWWLGHNFLFFQLNDQAIWNCISTRFIYFVIHCNLKRILYWKPEILLVVKDAENPVRGKRLVKVREDKKHHWMCLLV